MGQVGLGQRHIELKARGGLLEGLAELDPPCAVGPEVLQEGVALPFKGLQHILAVLYALVAIAQEAAYLPANSGNLQNRQRIAYNQHRGDDAEAHE